MKSFNTTNQNVYANSGVSAMDQWLKDHEESDNGLTIETQAM